ncbi:MAG: NAD(P)-dependent oxidoreductase [Chloroflexi bacterium]|nr:MAG: NAD(P)-dependent oxidoreductase [Chloroflexota bacterium]TME04017.1 MAG: NAD(P)-dependent oxidoreductase [Chloroflexota bacterium]TME36859.1 MAG: NAD(P)-dependent oxidoreductase [Chloroflexota bacterium]TME50609.1 MAG: NAD(P)-dependent oxidoreductase [Chloroflexota bacterium]
MRVAILGTGKMGAAIARHLSESGHELTLWNRTRSRADAVGVGSVASTPAEAVKAAEVVISILTDAAAVRSAYLGDHGAVTAARDQVFIEMSTAGPDVVKEVQAVIERGGAKFIECPVVGSISAMETGKGILFAAGDDAAIEKGRPVLEAIGEVRRIKDPESAARLKLIANTVLMGLSALAAEVLAAGAAAGVDTEDVFWVLTRFSPVLAARRAGYMEHKYEPVMFALRDAAKDLRLATEVYRKAGASTPMTETARDLFERAARTAGDLDLSAISTLYDSSRMRP